MTLNSAHTDHAKRFWVWVWSRDNYLDKNGEEHPEFDPSYKSSERPDNWSTCHKDTRAGDLVLLYRSNPRSDIAYLWEARSNARIWRNHPVGTLTWRQWEKKFDAFVKVPRSVRYIERKNQVLEEAEKLGISDDEVERWLQHPSPEIPEQHRKVWQQYMAVYHDVNRAMGLSPDPVFANDFEGSWVCDYEPRFKLNEPLTREAIASDPYLFTDWKAFRGNFQRRVYEIPKPIWVHLIDRIAPANPGYKGVVKELSKVATSADIMSECKLEDALEGSIEKLSPEYRLAIFVSPEGVGGRQYPCYGNPGLMGFIDLLCKDKETGGFIVIELKVTRAGLPAYAQLRSYMGWVREHLASGQPVRGLLIADGFDEKFRYAREDGDRVATMELAEVRTKLGLG